VLTSRRLVVVAALAVGSLVATSCTSDSDDGASATGSTPPSALLPAPVTPVPALLDAADVQRAVDQLDSIVADAMERTGVPGIAVGVVHDDEVVFTAGYGVRVVGEPATVDPDTVFQVASVSKPVATAVVAGVVGEGKATWDDPVRTWNADFAFSDPYVTANASLADLLSHRSGLPGNAGDLLEDLGWERDHILGVLDQQPLEPFRATYDYSNFGITEGGVTAADAAGTTWEDLADDVLFEPLGMASSSYRHADYEARENKAAIHVRSGDGPDATWRAGNVRDADAEAPAGGLSTSVNDMVRFVRLQLGAGSYEGREVIDPAALQVTHVPHQELSQPTDPAMRTQFYGLGWNVTTDDLGRVRLDHSGAFASGASTNVMMLPGESLGIVTLTNGQPLGLPEAINDAFLDAAQNGSPTVDWVGYWLGVWGQIYEAMAEPGEQWATPPANAAPAGALSVYEGVYQNSYYGPLTVVAAGDQLTMSMGPPERPTSFPLRPFDGNTFVFDTIGENASGPSGAAFTLGPDGRAASVELAAYDTTGLGTFTRG
jgi:CubicO group peptidase (beta-lactamase class C family)